MKILVLLLSLLYGVSGMGSSDTLSNLKNNLSDYYNQLLSATEAKVCQIYSEDGDYRESKCYIPAFYFDNQEKQSCYSIFKTKFNDQEGSCVVPKAKLMRARDNCITVGLNCPRLRRSGLQPQACSDLKSNDTIFQNQCSLSGSEKQADYVLADFLDKLLRTKFRRPDSCTKATTQIRISRTIAIAVRNACSEIANLCTAHCSDSICKRYKERSTLWSQEEEGLRSLFQRARECRNNLKSEGNVNQSSDEQEYQTQLNLIKKEQADQIVEMKEGDKDINDIWRVSLFNKTKGKTGAFSNNESENNQNSQQNNQQKVVVNKFNANTNYVKDTFNKLDQKMADRLNQGKTTKEDRKPNNTIASVNNDTSLPNKNKSNKYLVASSNDSFLTKKDIFKTVSNAYYKMCQTDSCYGIVKK